MKFQCLFNVLISKEPVRSAQKPCATKVDLQKEILWGTFILRVFHCVCVWDPNNIRIQGEIVQCHFFCIYQTIYHEFDDDYASSKYYWDNKRLHLPIAFVQRQKIERSLQNGTKTGHLAQSISLNLLWHRMAKIDPHVKHPEMSRWREPLVSGGHAGLACLRVLGSDPGRMCESMHASMGHIPSPPPSRSRFIVRF